MEAARAAGLTPGQVRHRVDSGRWVSIGHGAYLAAHRLADRNQPHLRARQQHAAASLAAAARNPGSVIAFDSAAIVNGLPLWSGTPDVVTLAGPNPARTGIRGGVRMRKLDVPGAHLSPDAPVTTPSRTWVDLARTASVADALSAGDAGLRSRAVTMPSIRRVMAECSGLRGMPHAQLVFEHLSARRESPLESASWAYFLAHHIELPETQVDIVDDRGVFVGRVDFHWPRIHLIGECDGRMKYDDPKAGYAEKRREDALRELGYRVVRWGAGDLRGPRLAASLRARGLVVA